MTYLPAAGVAAWVAGSYWMSVVGVTWFAAIATMVVGLGMFRCPLCSQPFHRKPGVRGSPFYFQCMHCGMSLRTFD